MLIQTVPVGVPRSCRDMKEAGAAIPFGRSVPTYVLGAVAILLDHVLHQPCWIFRGYQSQSEELIPNVVAHEAGEDLPNAAQGRVNRFRYVWGREVEGLAGGRGAAGSGEVSLTIHTLMKEPAAYGIDVGEIVTGHGRVYPPEQYVIQYDAHVGPEQAQSPHNVRVNVHLARLAAICGGLRKGVSRKHIDGTDLTCSPKMVGQISVAFAISCARKMRSFCRKLSVCLERRLW